MIYKIGLLYLEAFQRWGIIAPRSRRQKSEPGE